MDKQHDPGQFHGEGGKGDKMGRASVIYYTVAEAAVLLKVSEETLRRACKSGKIPSLKVVSQYRIPASYVVAQQADE